MRHLDRHAVHRHAPTLLARHGDQEISRLKRRDISFDVSVLKHTDIGEALLETLGHLLHRRLIHRIEQDTGPVDSGPGNRHRRRVLGRHRRRVTNRKDSVAEVIRVPVGRRAIDGQHQVVNVIGHHLALHVGV